MTDPTPTAAAETLEEFKNSFSYGSRSDMSFKFLKSLTPEQAGTFFRELLREIGASFDHGDVRLIHRLVNEWQVLAYQMSGRTYEYDTGPFTPLRKPLAESRLGVLTSSGHFVAGDDPKPFGVEHMSQQEAEDRIGEFLREIPTLSAIPVDGSDDDLLVRHGGYDVRSVIADPEVAFPRRTLQQVVADGRLGALSSPMYSFTGATSQGRLRTHALPGWIDRLRGDEIDVLLLVPV